MAGLLIFVPTDSVTADAGALLAGAGLGDLIDPADAAPVVCQSLVTMAARTGQLVYWDDQAAPHPASVSVDRQCWSPCRPREGLPAHRAWLGWYTDRRPTPACLSRRKRYPGRTSRMADGNEWLVPTMRDLPRVMDFDASGGLVLDYAEERFRELADRTFDLWARAALPEDQNEPLTFAEYFRFCADVLGLNYRINVDVLAALRLVSTEAIDVLFAAAGVPSLEDAKKNGLISRSGDAD